MRSVRTPLYPGPLSEALPMASLPSRAGDGPCPAARRMDPYYSGLWVHGSQGQWVSRGSARRQEEAGVSRVPSSWSQDPEQAWETLTTPTTFPHLVDALGYLGSWRTLTGEQLAAFTGNGAFATPTGRINRALFATGLADIGSFHNALTPTARRSAAQALRPSRSDTFEREVRPLLTHAEYIAITGGRKWTAGRQADRHNILGAELALRASEFTEVATCLGEGYSTLDMLDGQGLGRERLVTPAAADQVLVRGDGLRIAVEVTASPTGDLRKKIAAWARVLARTPLERSGLVVMFVGAPHPDDGDRAKGEFRRLLRKHVRESLRDLPSAREVASRIGVVLWDEWFPAPGMVHPDFLTLRTWRLENGDVGNDAWVHAGFLDEFATPLEAYSPRSLQSVIATSSALASPPVWLRRETQDAGWDVLSLTRRMAQAPPCPVPPPADPRRRHLHVPDTFRGPGARATTPPRLSLAPTRRSTRRD